MHYKQTDQVSLPEAVVIGTKALTDGTLIFLLIVCIPDAEADYSGNTGSGPTKLKNMIFQIAEIRSETPSNMK